jgi:hypothetical protein
MCASPTIPECQFLRNGAHAYPVYHCFPSTKLSALHMASDQYVVKELKAA